MIWIETGPAGPEPVTVAAAKAFLRIDRDDEDDLLAELIGAAREAAEAATGLLLRRSRHRIVLDSVPDGGRIALARRPVRAVIAATRFDEDGVGHAVDLTTLVLRDQSFGAALTLPALEAPNGVEIEVETGLDAVELPHSVRLATLQLVAVAYETRSAVPREMQPAAMPAPARALLAPFRAVRV